MAIKQADSLYSAQKYIDALDLYISQLSQTKRNESDSLYLTLLSRIGLVYDVYGDYGRSFYYYEKVLTDPKAAQFDDLYSGLLIKMVVGFSNMKDAAKARYYYEQQLRHPARDSTFGEYYRYTNGGLVEKMEGHNQKALQLFCSALASSRRHRLGAANDVSILLEIADIFSRMHQPDSALSYLNRACDLSEKNRLDSYASDSYGQLYRLYKSIGDSVTAMHYLERFSTTADSANMAHKLDIASLRLLQSHDEQARQEITTLNEQIDFQIKTMILFLGFCLVLVAFAVHTRLQHRRLKASYKLLIAKSDEIFQLEEQTVSQPLPTLPSPTPQPAADNPILERVNTVLNNIDFISQQSFSLADLSREAGSNTKYVSTLINEVYKKNFRTLLNERRIKEATRRLSNDRQYGSYSIADIAESLGYSSSTVFISAFKKVIGMTPAVYRRYRSGGE